MKAAILVELNEPLIVDEIRLPSSLNSGQVLVRVITTSICGAQIGEITGAKGPDRFLPHLLGHEGYGQVKAVGPAVRTVKEGDYVVMHWRKGSGIEAEPPKYKWGDKIVGAGPIATFAEETIVSENRLTKIDPGETSPHVLPLFGCAITTALGLLNNEAQLKIGQTIAVAGVGGVGLNVVQGARMVSASMIIAIDLLNYKLGLAKMAGATHMINDRGYDIVKQIQDIVGDGGVDVFVECTGQPQVIENGLFAVKCGGKMVLVGQPHFTEQVMFENFRHRYCGITVMDSQGGLTDPNRDVPRYLAVHKAGMMPLDFMITHTLPLEKINEAFDIVKSNNAGRVVLGIGVESGQQENGQ